MTALQFTRLRRKRFKTQAKAAEALGVRPSAISNWETGYRPVPLIVVKFLACLERRVIKG